MTCLTCKSLDLRKHSEMAKIGYGHCEHTSAGCFNSITAPKCEKFVAVDEDLAGKRVEWVENSRFIK